MEQDPATRLIDKVCTITPVDGSVVYVVTLPLIYEMSTRAWVCEEPSSLRVVYPNPN